MVNHLHSLQYIAAEEIVTEQLDTNVLPKLLRDYVDSIKCLHYWYFYTERFREPFEYFEDHGVYCGCADFYDWLNNTQRTLEFFVHIHGHVCFRCPGDCIEELLTRFDLRNFHFDGHPVVDYIYED